MGGDVAGICFGGAAYVAGELDVANVGSNVADDGAFDVDVARVARDLARAAMHDDQPRPRRDNVG